MAMAKQIQVQRRSSDRQVDDSPGPAPTGAAATERGNELREQIDAMVDEIDAVLEENAEEFVTSYVQQGGE